MDSRITSRLIAYALTLSILAMGSCDPFQHDAAPQKVTINPSALNYYTLTGNPVIINLKTLVNAAFINATMKVSVDPLHGELIAGTDFLLRYNPSPDFKKGGDQFSVTFSDNNQVLTTAVILINITNNPSELPCGFYALSDSVFMQASATQHEKKILFLQNDQFCNVDKSSIKVHISQPDLGTAELRGDTLVFESHFAPQGQWDTGPQKAKTEILYKITARQGSSTLESYGVVAITIAEDKCTYPDGVVVVLDLTDPNPDPMSNNADAGLDCPEGYLIDWISAMGCTRNRWGGGNYTRTANSGTFCINDYTLSNAIYIPDPQATPKNDTMTFHYWVNGSPLTKVTLIVKRLTHGCSSLATIGYEKPAGSVSEGDANGIVVKINLSAPAAQDMIWSVFVSDQPLVYGIVYTTFPESVLDTASSFAVYRAMVPIARGATQAQFKIYPVNDNVHTGNRTVRFQMLDSDSMNCFVGTAATNTFFLTIEDDD